MSIHFAPVSECMGVEGIISKQNVEILKLMTFNLRVDTLFDFSNRWSNRIASVADLLSVQRPVICGTQEGTLKMLRRLVKASPSYQFVGSGAKGGNKGESTAILFDSERVHVVESGQFWLSDNPEVPSKGWDSAHVRTCTWARFRHRDAPQVEFVCFNTHLDNRGAVARERASRLIWEKIQMYCGNMQLPIVFMGDLNAEPQSATVKFWRGQARLDGATSNLLDTAAGTEAACGSTYHGFRGGLIGEHIDYIFVSQQLLPIFSTVERRKFLGRYPSDHYPVVANVQCT